MTGTLILVRHGQTFSNVAKKLDTLPPGAALTPKGHQQARALAASITERPAAVISSIALRARETAGYIADATGVPLQSLEGLQETYVGDAEDRSDDESHNAFQDVYRKWLIGDTAASMPGGESADVVLARFVSALDSLNDALESGDVYVVSHGAAIRLVACVLAGVDPDFAATNHLDNTETVELVKTSDGWDCVRWGAHVPPFEASPTESADDPMG